MTVQQMFVAFSCLLLATQQIAAVVNNPKSVNLEETSTSKNVSSTGTKDSASAATEQEAKRREAPIIAVSDTYGLPLTGAGVDTYIPTGPSNPTLPIPVYGVPDGPSSNIIYPAPPPDIPPPLPSVSSTYGIPLPTYGAPQTVDFGSSFLNNFIPPPPPPTKYLPPIKSHKHFISSSFHSKPSRPRPQYGVPHKPVFVPKLPKPKPVYGPPKTPLFVPQKNNFQQQSLTIVTIPSAEYGVPNLNIQEPLGPVHHPSGNYGPPEPIQHGPPHPGVPAPPTPPDIKYDGWQPIPGLVSRPPSDSYGVPEGQHHDIADLQLNSDFTPPPIGSSHGHISTPSHSITVGYSPPTHGVSDSYGAPLNAVTGSGAVDSSSGDAHHDDHSLSLGLSAAGINGQSHLSVIKSIGYELFPNSGTLSHIGDSYSSPPLSSYSSDGPYAAAHSYKTSGLSSGSHHGSSIKSHQSSHFHSSHNSHISHGSHSSHGSHGHSSSSIGLVPPSGLYGTPPSGQYGTPLLSKPSHQYGAPLNALKINPPKHPVIFREPVPAGLIESIGQHTAHKDAHGIIESSHSTRYSSGSTYIPPPIPDVAKPVREEEPPVPSHLYSLPNPSSGISFQNVVHGSSLPEISSLSLNSNHFSGGHSQGFTSYTAPLGSIDGSYSLPLHAGPGYSIALDNAHSGGLTVGIDHSLPPISIDLTTSTTNLGKSIAQLPHAFAYQNGHDCKSHGSQPLPSLSYGVPSANSYTASLSTLTTNIGGAHQSHIPSGSYGPPDLHTEHSKKVATVVSANSIDGSSHGKSYGKSLAQKFGPDSELIRSQSIDINNIPLKGSLGSYTLQIQSADGIGGSKSSSEQISHAQVLNGGLLQSILAAIEQPERKDATILGRPLSHLKPSKSYSRPLDSEGQHSVNHAVVVPAPVTEATSTTTTSHPQPESAAPLRLIDNNEIALYFSNNLQDDADFQDNKNSTEDAVRNGQQYGSYVSFKTPNTSYVYGKLSSDKSQETGEKD